MFADWVAPKLFFLSGNSFGNKSLDALMLLSMEFIDKTPLVRQNLGALEGNLTFREFVG